MHVACDGRSLASPVLRGMDRYVVGLVGALVRAGVRVTLLHRERQPLHAPHLAGLGCAVVGLPDRSGVHWEQVALPAALLRGRFDVYHAPAERGVPLVAPCPVVLTIHSLTTLSYGRLVARGLLPGPVSDYLGTDGPAGWRRWYDDAQFRWADHILAPSAYCRDEIVDLLHVHAERVTVTPLAAHAQFRRPPREAGTRNPALARLGIRAPYLLYVGGYEPHKNVVGLLDVFARVRRARPDLGLVVVGSKGLPPQVMARAERLGLGDAVTFLVDATDVLPDVYDGAELFVSQSWRETFCLPALEAMTRGVPVVLSAWGASREVVGDVGHLVDPRDHAAAAAAVLEVLARGDRDARADVLRRAAARFDWDRTAAVTYDVYAALCGRSRRVAVAS